MTTELQANKRPWYVLPSVLSIAVTVAVVAFAAMSLSSIDDRLKRDAEQEVVIFTEQAALNANTVRDTLKSAIESFTVQSANPEEVQPALVAMRDNFGFESVAFAQMDGTGLLAGGVAFNVSELSMPETALSQGKWSTSDTYESAKGVSVSLVQKPLYVDGTQVGALYVEVPLSLLAAPSSLEMFDGLGYFILFNGETGEVILPPANAPARVSAGDSLYDAVEEAGKVGTSTAGNQGLAPELDTTVTQARQQRSIDELRRASESGEGALVVASVGGVSCYLCVEPVGDTVWRVCNVIPVRNVRAEATLVSAMFQGVFIVVLLCLAAVISHVFVVYRRHVREQENMAKTRLLMALASGVDADISLYDPVLRRVTPVSGKTAEILGASLAELMADETAAGQLSLPKEGSDLLDRLRTGRVAKGDRGLVQFRLAASEKARWLSYSVDEFVCDSESLLLVALRDVTEEKELQLSIREAAKAATAANNAKSTFLSRMSHEIRTPMTAVIGAVQIAQKQADDPVQTKENLGRIAVASEHLLSLINEVLDISKIESGRSELSVELFHLPQLVDSAVSVVTPQFEAKGISFTCELPEGSGPLLGDAGRLERVLVNLLGNAAKYTLEKGHVSLTVTAVPGDLKGSECLTFVVADDGIGMEPEFLERVFDPFAMEGRGSSMGSGLGMSIVRSCVQMMGGEIRVRSEVGHGSAFTVTLTFMRPPSASESGRANEGAAASEPAAESGAASSPEPEFDLVGVHILLAEDNELNAAIVGELLRCEGMVVERAADGRQACELFAASEEGFFDAVLMDVRMPVMGGTEAARCIRELNRADAKTVPIVAISANAFAEDVRASLESGMNAHLSKPVNVVKTKEVLAKLIQERKAER